MAAPVQSSEVTKFPRGASSFGFPLIGSGPFLTTGRVFFVDSTAGAAGDDTDHGTEPASPFATLDFAIGQCVADRGDFIFCLQGHVEPTLLSAGAINCDVAGITIVGLGEGRTRPTFTFTTSTAADLNVGAANITLLNCVFDLTAIDALAAPIDVNAAGFTMQFCEFITADAGGQCERVIVTDNNADRMRICDNIFNGSSDAGVITLIDLTGTPDGVEICRNRFIGEATNAMIESPAAQGPTSLFIHTNDFHMLGSAESAIKIVNSISTGIIANNTVTADDPSVMIDNSSFSVSAIGNLGYDSNLSSSILAVPIPVVGTNLSAGQSIHNEIVTADFGFGRINNFTVTADMSISTTWETVAKHRIAVVGGTAGGFVRVRIIPYCTSSLTTGGAPFIKLGVVSDTALFIASTDATLIDTNEFWFTTLPVVNAAVVKSATIGLAVPLDFLCKVGEIIGYEITAAALTGGVLKFHIWWELIGGTNTDVVAGDGSTF